MKKTPKDRATGDASNHEGYNNKNDTRRRKKMEEDESLWMRRAARRRTRHTGLGRLTSGTQRRRGTSPDGAQSACRACAYAVLARRAVPCVAVAAAVERTTVRLGRVVAGRGRDAEAWRGEGKGEQVRLRHGLRRRERRRVD